MEISEQTLVDLVKGQARIEQAVTDLKEGVGRTIPMLIARDDKFDSRLRGVEGKIWYFGGAGTVVGAVLSHLGDKFFHFGGK